MGFARDIIVALLFGAGLGADAFFVAFRIPNFVRRLFAEGAFAQAFVPVLAEYDAQHRHREVRALIAHVSGSLGVVTAAIGLVGVLAAPAMVTIFAPGFRDDPGRYGLTQEMLRITFPYVLFVSLTGLAGGILNSYQRFAVPAFTPALLNLAIIGCALWLAPYLAHPVTALAWGVALGGGVQLAFQLPFLWRLGCLVRPRPSFADPGARRVLRRMVPTLFASSVAQTNLLFGTLVASFLDAGSVSWLYYSERLVEFPLGVLGVAVATAILPKLSRDHARASEADFSHTLDWALRIVALIAVPAGLGLTLLAGPLMAALFQHGQFELRDAQMAARSLAGFAFGLPGLVLVKVLVPGFYARHDTRTPLRIGVVAVMSNMVMAVALVFPLRHAGLALSASLAAYLNAGLLYRALRRSGTYQPRPGWRALAQRSLLANVVMVAVLWPGVGDVTNWAQWDAMGRLVRLAWWVSVGGALYFGTLVCTGLRLRHVLPGHGA